MTTIEQIQRRFEDRGYLTEDEWYQLLLLKREGPMNVQYPSQEDVESFGGRLPSLLLRFWQEQGWSSWGNGKFWVCDPHLLAPIVETVFEDDPDYVPDQLTPFGYDAFGHTFIWIGSYRILRLHWLYNSVTEQVLPNWNNHSNVPVSENEAIIGFLDAEMVTGYGLRIAWADIDGEDMLPTAISRLGVLAPGEIYGFVPALSMGGVNRVENLQRLPIVEHMMFLANVQRPMLHRYHPPPEIGQGFGEIEIVRPIGRQE